MKSKAEIIRKLAEAIRASGFSESADYWERLAEEMEEDDGEGEEGGGRGLT